jgi:penicillin amidase
MKSISAQTPPAPSAPTATGATLAIVMRPPRRRYWPFLLKLLSGAVLAMVIVLAILIVWFRSTANAALPRLDGSIAVLGLNSDVFVVRDTHGVPHITAANLADLFFAQGYVTAQDRLWQLDMSRRYVAGETAEILFESTGNWIQHDKKQRILRLRVMAATIAARLSTRDKAFFEAYTRGVNAYMDQARDHLPVEFHILNYRPKPWTVTDSVLVSLGMSQSLNTQYEIEYWRGKFREKLSPEMMRDLYPDHSIHDHPPGVDFGKVSSATFLWTDQDNATTSSVTHHLVDTNSDLCESCLPGSNGWVVSGAHTASGSPLLANDIHLAHQIPGVWYEIHLHSDDFDVEGVSLPGVPFVVAGHNRRIAWGLTNLNADVQDLFVENLNSAGQYETPEGWKSPERDHEVIHTRSGRNVEFDVLVTRHGPIISSLFPGESRNIALEWIIYYDQVNIPLFDLNAAQNWQQFRSALSRFTTPSQSVVYADIDGHIGYQAMGSIPVRASGDGSVPVSGADDRSDWISHLPFNMLPSVFDPPSGVIAVANDRVTPDGYPYLITLQWYPPYRAERIYDVLGAKTRLTPADMLALQTDVVSGYDGFIAHCLADAVDHSSRASGRMREAAGLLRSFNGVMLAGSPAAAIEVRARRVLWQMLLEPKMGKEWDKYEWGLASVALESILKQRPARWLPPGYENFDDLLAQAVQQALAHAPANLQSLGYGQDYSLEINHPLFGVVPVLNKLAGPGSHPQSGGSYTVKQVGRHFGPSERMTVDLADLDDSTLNLVMGQSGNLFSPYYMDHWNAWYGSKTFLLPFSEARIQAAEAHFLLLHPGKGTPLGFRLFSKPSKNLQTSFEK